jgi:hypothetical protein
MVVARTLRSQARVRQADRGEAVPLLQIEADQCLWRVLLPVREPGEDQQARTLNRTVLSANREGLAASADAPG